MKSETQLRGDIFASFMRSHPELQISGMDSMTMLLNSREKIYAKVAIDHAIHEIYEILIMEGAAKKK